MWPEKYKTRKGERKGYWKYHKYGKIKITYLRTVSDTKKNSKREIQKFSEINEIKHNIWKKMQHK